MMTRTPTAQDLDQLPVGHHVVGEHGRVWEHLRESGWPWEDLRPAWRVVDNKELQWLPRDQTDTLHLLLAYGPFTYREVTSDDSDDSDDSDGDAGRV